MTNNFVHILQEYKPFILPVFIAVIVVANTIAIFIQAKSKQERNMSLMFMVLNLIIVLAYSFASNLSSLFSILSTILFLIVFLPLCFWENRKLKSLRESRIGSNA